MSISSYASDSSAASYPHSHEFIQSIPSRQSGMVQPVVHEMFATVHAAGSSPLESMGRPPPPALPPRWEEGAVGEEEPCLCPSEGEGSGVGASNAVGERVLSASGELDEVVKGGACPFGQEVSGTRIDARVGVVCGRLH
eukprot:scaffold564_cov101-Isochrysis_galbana.AAC.4